MPQTQASPTRNITVWDAPTRVFHWLLAATIATAAITGFLLNASWITVHLTAGIIAIALVLFRLVWGFTGSWPSRFAAFWPRRAELLHHMRTLNRRSADAHASHNPLGALMVFALLAVVLALSGSGLVLWGGVLKQGPLKALVSFATGAPLRGFHELLAITLLVLVAAHIAGVVFESWRSRENLARSMVTGVKQLPAHMAPGLAATPAQPGRAALASLAMAAPLALLALWGTSRTPQGVPQAALDPAYVEACGECHTAFHPSLLPAATWQAVMAGLDDHFGEDATLPADTTAQLATYLAANSAEHWDTLPAHMFRTASAAEPLRITATAGWQRRHGELPAALFTSPAVKSRTNCAACHGDAASGLFAPQSIMLPKEKTP